jgi:prepilin-type processing-associated H-X9-DG protein/prepilin-type N-terminal cleavage/methylation domain-containing protein
MRRVTPQRKRPQFCLRPLPHRSAFTIIELVVVIAIIATLMSILLPALHSARESAKKLVCSVNMRTISREFDFFVRGESAEGQGDSEQLGPNYFRMNDFQEQLYGIDEFWDQGDTTFATLRSSSEVMMCPSGTTKLERRKGFPCGRESITPVAEVTLAMNMRLYRTTLNFRGKSVLSPVRVTRVSSRILDRPFVPIVMEVDGEGAGRAGIDPFYLAPPNGEHNTPYSSGHFWTPSTRHGGKINVALTDGHVESSGHPETERWDWKYQAEAKR